ncbi:MAG: response regulator [Cyclobacteriaceae bacterium]|nr:response regulator [Cyclobacteriaceae bacterium]
MAVDVDNLPILIVDDLPENLLALKKVLTMHGHEVETAISGEEALRKCLKQQFDLFILDVQMPGMDGFELATHLKGAKKTKDIPIIFVTAISREDHHVKTGYETGAIDYLFKPLNTNLLNLKVSSFLQVRRQQKVLEFLMEELEEKNKELMQFSYMVSHDLKNPLWGIGGLLECIGEELVDPGEETKEFLMLAKSKVLHMEKLISGLLEYSKAGTEKLKMEDIEMDKLIEVVISNTPVPDSFTISVSPDMPTIHGYKLLLQQVLANLISNAIKHNDKEKGLLHITQTNGNGLYTFRISDNGPGVPNNLKERIFDLFQTGGSHDTLDSTGIGLSITRKLINKHRGEVWVEDGESGGSVFCFTVPG